MNRNYPIILGGGDLRKGLMAMRGEGMGGFDLYIVWLKREFPHGARFEVDDIESVQQVIHFADRETLEITVRMLTDVLKDWKERM
ncbi:MAG: hypothetical protein IKI84_01195 [Clostridia bacterium]|nr:hypothetical protein [Clostridia bacterium]